MTTGKESFLIVHSMRNINAFDPMRIAFVFMEIYVYLSSKRFSVFFDFIEMGPSVQVDASIKVASLSETNNVIQEIFDVPKKLIFFCAYEARFSRETRFKYF